MENRYNGWKNRETWLVALWISNDEPLYTHYHLLAKLCYETYKGRSLENFYQIGSLANAIRNQIEIAARETLDESSLLTDLIMCAIYKVDYTEIAEHLIEEVKEDD